MFKFMYQTDLMELTQAEAAQGGKAQGRGAQGGRQLRRGACTGSISTMVQGSLLELSPHNSTYMTLWF